MGARRRGPASRGRRVVTALAVIGLGLGLGGCTGNLVVDPGPSTAGAAIADVRPTGPDEWRRTVPLEPLTVPAEMVAPADRFDGGAMVSGTPSNPALVAAVGTRPGGERYLRVSRWTGTGFEHGSVTPPAPGSVQAVAAAGNATVTALAGWTWQTGSIAPFLLISTDRRSWTPVDLPVELAGYRIVAVAADGGQLVALAQHPSGSAVVVSLDPGAPSPCIRCPIGPPARIATSPGWPFPAAPSWSSVTRVPPAASGPRSCAPSTAARPGPIRPRSRPPAPSRSAGSPPYRAGS